jgi:hypothetical protein
VHECCAAMPAVGNAGQDDALAHVADERGGHVDTQQGPGYTDDGEDDSEGSE